MMLSLQSISELPAWWSPWKHQPAAFNPNGEHFDCSFRPKRSVTCILDFSVVQRLSFPLQVYKNKSMWASVSLAVIIHPWSFFYSGSVQEVLFSLPVDNTDGCKARLHAQSGSTWMCKFCHLCLLLILQIEVVLVIPSTNLGSSSDLLEKIALRIV